MTSVTLVVTVVCLCVLPVYSWYYPENQYPQFRLGYPYRMHPYYPYGRRFPVFPYRPVRRQFMSWRKDDYSPKQPGIAGKEAQGMSENDGGPTDDMNKQTTRQNLNRETTNNGGHPMGGNIIQKTSSDGMLDQGSNKHPGTGNNDKQETRNNGGQGMSGNVMVIGRNANKQTVNNNNKPETDNNAGQETNNTVNHESRSNVDQETGSNIKQKTGSNINQETISNINQETISNINHETGSNIKQKTGSNIKQETGSNINQETGSNINQETGSNIKQKTGSNIKQETGSNIKKETGSNIKQETGSNIKQETGSNIKKDTGNNINQETGTNNGKQGTAWSPGNGSEGIKSTDNIKTGAVGTSEASSNSNQGMDKNGDKGTSVYQRRNGDVGKEAAGTGKQSIDGNNMSDLHGIASRRNENIAAQMLPVTENYINPQDAVAFSAVETIDQYFYRGGPLIFDDVITNLGGGYNPQYGIFTAPAPGIYTFHYHVISKPGSPKLAHVDLLKNDKVINSAKSTGECGSGANTATLNLSQFDRVTVQGRQASIVGCGSNARLCSFSGSLSKIGYFSDQKITRESPLDQW